MSAEPEEHSEPPKLDADADNAASTEDADSAASTEDGATASTEDGAADRDNAEGEAWASSRKPEVSDGKRPLLRVLLTLVVVVLAMTLALQHGFRGSTLPWFIMAAAYLGLAAYAALDMSRRGVLVERFRIRPGDASIGIVVGLVLCAGGAVTQRLLAVEGSQGANWLVQVHEYGGDFQTNGVLIFVLFVLCLCEETVWRGMVQDHLSASSSRAAPALTALAYAASTLPSLFLLDKGSALNPLLVLAALGTGVIWSYARRAVPRLFPLIVSHLVFTYFMAAPLPAWIVPMN